MECENNTQNKTYLDNLIILYKEDCILDAWMCCVLLIIGKVKKHNLCKGNLTKIQR